jgi:hypothetical protein
MTPYRVQLSRQKGFRLPANTIVVARPSRWGNPFGDKQWGVIYPPFPGSDGLPLIPLRSPIGRQRTLDLYVAWLRGRLDSDPKFLSPLWGKNLACWCKPEEMCHADILLRAASGIHTAYANTVAP